MSLAVVKRLTFLIALAAVSCTGLKKFPTDRIYEFDPKTPICAEYKITDYENMKYEWVQDIPFKSCPPIFGFRDKEIPDVLNWAQDAQTYDREHCH